MPIVRSVRSDEGHVFSAATVTGSSPLWSHESITTVRYYSNTTEQSLDSILGGSGGVVARRSEPWRCRQSIVNWSNAAASRGQLAEDA